MSGLPLLMGGLVAGLFSGLLGIGGGSILVPILLTLGATPVNAIATSSLAIIVTSVSGSFQNWRMGQLQLRQALPLGIPAVFFAQLGVRLADLASDRVLLIAFGVLMLVNLGLLSLRQKLIQTQQGDSSSSPKKDSTPHSMTGVMTGSLFAKLVTGSLAGAIAGLLGVGGGAIMVPLQMLLLQTPIKRAIQTSLGVVVLTAIASTAGHAANGNVLWIPGLTLGFGGLLSAQFSTRLLPKLPDTVVSLLFRLFLIFTAFYSFWKAFST